MKRLILILILITSAIQAQTHNELIWNYANDRIGERVGDGSCFSLIEEAYHQFCNCKLKSFAGVNKVYLNLGREIPKDSLIAGDIVMFQYYDKEKKKGSGHIGIVYAINELNMSIAHQNYNAKRKKDSKVEITVWSDIIKVDSTVEQSVIFYRPF